MEYFNFRCKIQLDLLVQKTVKFVGFEKTFTLWMDIRAELREIIFQGMKNFEWK